MKVRIEGLVKSYRGKRALDGITFTVPEGEIFGFIGPNGAGKTTTLSILAGLIGFDGGVCEVDGKPARAGRGIGYLPEQPVFFDQLTAREYLGLLERSMALPRGSGRAEELLARVSLERAADRRIGGYSRGMRQRLGLACALMGRPDTLILDEPSSALDPEGRRAVVDLIRDLRTEGKTVILSTHILSDIERVCDRIALIDTGRILVEGAVEDLLGEGFTGSMDLVFSRPLAAREMDSLRSLPGVDAVVEEDGALRVDAAVDPAAARAHVIRRVAELSLPLVSLTPRRLGLEELFLRKVARHA